MAFMRDPLYILMQDGGVRIYHRSANEENPEVESWMSSFDQELFDEIVMMRYYNMTEEERRAAIHRVLETQFETGADGLRKACGRRTVMERVDEEIERRITSHYGGSR